VGRLQTPILCTCLALIAIAPLLAGCGGKAASGSPTVKLAYNAKLKQKILVGANGETLYLFSTEGADSPGCYDDAEYHCSKVWPPYRSAEKPVPGPGVDAALLSTVKRPDGKPQVTYNHHPLYTNAGSAENGLKPDRKTGDLNGQGFFSIWWVVSPSGKEIR
jgi:predicted lipoprotein with Yx(FWY)xxD motif